METDQRRARVGGEFGANGEWYEGGKFIATKDNPKSVPYCGQREDPAAADERRRQAASLNAWLDARRDVLSDIIDRLTANPGDVEPARWAWMLENGHAGFLPSLGRDLFVGGSLSVRQARFVVKSILGRETNRNAEAWGSMLSLLTEQFEAAKW